MDEGASDRPAAWMRFVLRAAAVYNLAWGAWVIAFPQAIFAWSGLEPPNYPQIWQCVGMIVGVYGVGYWLAAADPYRHWPIVLVGLLGKVFGPLGFAWSLVRGDFPPAFGLTIVTNDLVWWLPFGMILAGAFRANTAPPRSPGERERTLEEGLRETKTAAGRSLAELSTQRPLLVVFLRHAGCTFCREALDDLAARRDAIEQAGVGLAIVHMSPPAAMEAKLAAVGLAGVEAVSDPECRLYRAFELRRGSWSALFGPTVWRRGCAAFLRGYGVGRLVGDGFQMPGVFLLDRGRIVRAMRHRTAADRPDYEALACPVEGA